MPADELIAVVDRCRDEHVEEVLTAYVFSHEPVMATDLMKFVQECLAGKGIALTGLERSARDMIDTVPDSQMDELSGCMADGLGQPYPDVSSVGFPYRAGSGSTMFAECGRCGAERERKPPAPFDVATGDRGDAPGSGRPAESGM